MFPKAEKKKSGKSARLGIERKFMLPSDIILTAASGFYTSSIKTKSSFITFNGHPHISQF
jgi:hypothetical protein